MRSSSFYRPHFKIALKFVKLNLSFFSPRIYRFSCRSVRDQEPDWRNIWWLYCDFLYFFFTFFMKILWLMVPSWFPSILVRSSYIVRVRSSEISGPICSLVDERCVLESTNVPHSANLGSSPYPVTSWTQCQDLCQAMPDCQFSVLYPLLSICYLKNFFDTSTIRVESDAWTIFKYCRTGKLRHLDIFLSLTPSINTFYWITLPHQPSD